MARARSRRASGPKLISSLCIRSNNSGDDHDKKLPAGAALLLAFIGGIEGPKGYDVIYGNNQGKPLKRLTTMTLDEVIAGGPKWIKAFRSSAAGHYQFVNATLKELKPELGLRGDQTFDANLQDRLAITCC